MPQATISRTATRRLLGSPLLDRLLGPHGIDRYLELVRPTATVRDARAEVLAVRRQTPRSVTLTLRPNAAWSGFRAGQFVPVGVEIDGVRHTRTYSPAGSEHDDGTLELTATVHPGGLVSGHLQSQAAPGTILHLGDAQGDFVLPEPRPRTLVLISGGSGITPVLSMLRTLCDEGHDGEVVFLHYGRTAGDWLYEPDVRALARRHGNARVQYLATRERDGHLRAETIRRLLAGGEIAGAHAAVCGPPALIDAAREVWAAAGADGEQRVLSESFVPRPVVAGESGEGTVRFLHSRLDVHSGEGTLLEQAEAAGLAPAFGCRMGICHTCTCRKPAGTVRNVRTGEVSDAPDEDIQLCISVPAGDVALEL